MAAPICSGALGTGSRETDESTVPGGRCPTYDGRPGWKRSLRWSVTRLTSSGFDGAASPASAQQKHQ